MKWIWYVAQAAFIAWWVFITIDSKPNASPGDVIITTGIAICLCAFLTACLTQLWDWGVRRLRGLKGHRGNAGSDSLSLSGTGRSLSKAPEHPKRIRVGE